MEVAIITGGTRGIGAAIATGLAHRKVRLVLNSRNEDDEVRKLCATLGEQTEIRLVPGDAADPEIAAKLAQEANSSFGRIDYVVPAAGGPNPGKITDLSFDQWSEAFRVHVHAVFHLFRATQPALALRGGGF